MDLVEGRVIVKFGGADLSNGEKIRRAAEMIAKSAYKEVAVVVSAMGGFTNELVKIISEIGGVDDKGYADIVSMGERTSARIFTAALKARGLKSIYIEPSMDEWPIITDTNYKDAKPEMEDTRLRVKRFIEPLLSDTVPVICGFLGRDRYGNITTLGRGGSDTTALILGNCLRAEEVILVKETEGVMSADPKIVPKAKPLRRLDIHEIFALAHGGAKIIKAEALRYKLPGQKLRVVSFHNGLNSPGTEITGDFQFNSFEINEKRGLAAISIVCSINPETISSLFKSLGDRPIYGVSTGTRSITIFTSSDGIRETLMDLHDTGTFKAVSLKENVGMIRLTHPIFIDSPGWIAKISGALASKNINIIEITTSKASINIFIDESRLEDAVRAVKEKIDS